MTFHLHGVVSKARIIVVLLVYQRVVVVVNYDTLRPFWRYFGGKWRHSQSRHYPNPNHGVIVEPFAGSAGYALYWSGVFWPRDVILVEKNPIIAEIWRYLIATSSSEIARIPDVDHVDDLPSSTPEAARLFVGMCFGAGDTRPRVAVSSMVRRDGEWKRLRDRAVVQVGRIRHWRIIEGDYTLAPNVTATWFVDSPYHVAGARASKADRGRVRYPNGADDIDFMQLADWCRSRKGQIIVCEQPGASWLPFRSLGETQSVGDRWSGEVVWTNDTTEATCT